MKKYSILLILFFTFCSQTSSNETIEEVITPTTELIIEGKKRYSGALCDVIVASASALLS